MSIDDAIKTLERLKNLRDAREACEMGIQALEQEKAFSAGLIGPTIPDMEGTEPRLNYPVSDREDNDEDGSIW